MQIQTMAKKTRVSRKPNFPIAGTMKPFGLYPLWAHPVLPGETMQSCSHKMRNLSMPIKHPLGGAWLEQWTVYVKLTDIDDELGQMFISDDMSPSAFDTSQDRPRTFAKDGQIDWINLALRTVHEAYFVHENETPRYIDGVPMVKLNNISWYQNNIFEPDAEAVPTTDGDDTYQHLQAFQMLQQMQMTELTYEKYLETYGVSPARKQKGQPEILGFSRSWTQPTNAVDPTTGTPASAWVWNGDHKVDKAKRFQEPGFIMHLACVRPKMFQSSITSSLIGNLWGFSDWYPSYTLDDPTAGVKKIAKSDAIFDATATDAGTETVLYDHRDLLNHGEQFVNNWSGPYPVPASSGLSVQTGSEPEDLRGEYPVSADIDALFTGNTNTLRNTYYEGMAHLVISGHVQDTTL